LPKRPEARPATNGIFSRWNTLVRRGHNWNRSVAGNLHVAKPKRYLVFSLLCTPLLAVYVCWFVRLCGCIIKQAVNVSNWKCVSGRSCPFIYAKLKRIDKHIYVFLSLCVFVCVCVKCKCMPRLKKPLWSRVIFSFVCCLAAFLRLYLFYAFSSLTLYFFVA